MYYGPMLHLFKIIQDKTNSTLLTEHCAHQLNLTFSHYPIIYPAVNAFPGSQYSLNSLLNLPFHHYKSQIAVLRLDLADLNFAYCARPRKEDVVPWKVRLITTAFQPLTWLVLTIQLFLCAILVQFSISSQKSPLKNKTQLSFLLFTMATMIISSDNGIRKKLNISSLLVLWAFISMVLSNYYSGIVTSTAIKPPADKYMTRVSQLLENNFTLIFQNQADLDVLNATVQYYSKFEKSSDNRLSDTKKLIETSTLVTNTIGTGFGKVMACIKNAAAIDLWHNVLSFVNYANLAMDNSSNKTFRDCRCYIGKELIPNGDLYQIFTPPKGKLFGGLAKTLEETGFYFYWYTELAKMQFSTRVQDRQKVKGATSIIYDFEDELGTSTLKLEGRILTIFLTWFSCLVGGLLCFWGELAYKKVRKRCEIYTCYFRKPGRSMLVLYKFTNFLKMTWLSYWIRTKFFLGFYDKSAEMRLQFYE